MSPLAGGVPSALLIKEKHLLVALQVGEGGMGDNQKQVGGRLPAPSLSPLPSTCLEPGFPPVPRQVWQMLLIVPQDNTLGFRIIRRLVMRA